MSNPIFTIGHSDHILDAFLALLDRHTVKGVADIRSAPDSRRAPQFNRENINAFLKENGIEYVFLGRQLGARRSERSCYVNGRAEYEKIAELPIFKAGIRRICRDSEERRIALMCAEKDPLFCHRSVLVSPALVREGKEVVHIHADGRLEIHAELEERMIRETGVEPDLFAGGNDPAALVARAYSVLGSRLASTETEVTQQAGQPSVGWGQTPGRWG